MKNKLFEKIYGAEELYELEQEQFDIVKDNIHDIVADFMLEILKNRIEKIDSDYIFEIALQYQNLLIVESTKRANLQKVFQIAISEMDALEQS